MAPTICVDVKQFVLSVSLNHFKRIQVWIPMTTRRKKPFGTGSMSRDIHIMFFELPHLGLSHQVGIIYIVHFING